MKDTRHTVVLGLGNLIRSDDGAGVHALRRLQDEGRISEDVELVEGGTLGLDLLRFASNARRLLVLDAVDVGAPAGTVSRLSGPALAALPGEANVHQLGLADLLSAVRMLGSEPDEVVLLGVQPARTDLGTTLSPEIEGALPRLVEAALTQLFRWHCDG